MPTATATLAGKTLASSDSYEVIEGNIYFPPSALAKEYFSDSDTTTYCPWKGTAKYYDAEVEGSKVKDVAWYYDEPKAKVERARGFVAFYKSKVTVESEEKNPKNTITP